MGERMRSIDWSCTPLGAVDIWPRSLRTCVRIMLTSPQPMFVWWGADLINIYNDAYKAFAGGTHPQALGQPAGVMWRDEWDRVGRIAEAAIRRNEETHEPVRLLMSARNGHEEEEEEAYLTSSWSPVPGDDGGAGGVLCTSVEETQKIIGERQVWLLRDLAACTVGAHTVEAACARAAESLATNPRDLPFALLYLTDADRRSACLVSSAGISDGHPAAPRTLALEAPGGDGHGDNNRHDDNHRKADVSPPIWPVSQALHSREPIVVAAPSGLSEPLPTGAWHRPPSRIVIINLTPATARGRAAVLVAGLNPHRPFDESYRGFVELCARQIAAAIAGAEADERAPLHAGAPAPSDARAVLDSQRQGFYSFLAQAPVAITVFEGADLTVAYANDLTRRQVGGRDIVGKPLLQAMPELGQTSVPEHLTRVLCTGEPDTAIEEKVAVTRRDGTVDERYITTLRCPLRDDSGVIYGVISVGHDVTDGVLARRALASKTFEAEAASRAKDEFLAMLGHELRNPLAPINTALQLMQLRGGDTFHKERTIIDRQVKHLVRLVDDLLEVSRIARGKITLDRVRIELGDVLARALETSSPLIEQREHHLSVNVAPGLAVDADPARLAQVFANLLTNAAKYTPPGGDIQVNAQREGDAIAVSVRDTGIGIRPEVLPSIFDHFVQERQAIDRSRGGLGLGLTIVRSLVLLHGGTVEARSAGPGRGAEILLRLPRARDERPRDAVSPATRRRMTPHLGVSTAHARRVLVVDDNEDAVDSLAEALLELGHSVETARDGAAALGLLQRFIPDVVFLDIGLPVMDGYELARRIRGDRRFADTVLVALTGYGQKKDQLLATEAGFDAHLVKPVDIRAIEKIIAERGPPQASASLPIG